MIFKKNLILSVMAVVLLAAAIALYLFFTRPPLAIPAILPADAIYFARLVHPDKHLKEIGNSAFAKELAVIDIPKVMLKNGFSSDKITQVKEWQAQLNKILGHPLLGKVLSRELALAFYPEPLLVVRLEASVAAAEFLGKMSKSWGQDIELSQSTYKGFKIQHVVIKDKKITITYLRMRDLLVATLESSKQLERIIDVYLKASRSLAQDEHFASISSRSYAEAQGFAYINMALGIRQLKAQFNSWINKGDLDADSLGDMVGQLNAVYAYGLSFDQHEFSRIKIIAGVDIKAMMPAQRKFLSCPTGKNASVSFIPANAIGYHWGNCYDFADYWQQLKEQAHTSSSDLLAEAQQFKRKLEKRLKINIETEVLPVLGNEAGVYLTDIDTRGMFPFPRLLFFIKIKDRAGVDELLRRASANPLGVIQEEEYGKVKIRYMQLPFGANMDPGYSFVGDYLLVASSRQLLKKSVDVFAQPGRSLLQEKIFKQFGLGDGDKNNSVTFMKVGDLSLRAVALAGWVDKYFAAQLGSLAAYKQQAEGHSRQLADELSGNEEELTVAATRLQGLKAKLVSGVTGEELAEVLAATQHLQQEVDRLRADIAEGKAAIAQLAQDLIDDQARVQSTKLVIFNTDQILMPFLKAVGTINAQGMRVGLGDRFWETEIFLK